MPWTIEKNGSEFCVHKENADGSVGEQLKCYPTREKALAYQRALYANVEDAAMKYYQLVGVKTLGDWEIDILALPFGVRDSDGQFFDTDTDIMLDNFSSPAILYHHGVMPGRKELQDRPVVIGKAVSMEKRSDGWHIRALLDKAQEFARRVWEAAKNGLAVASSDSIAHLARLDVGDGRRIMYEKNRPGRIAVWPLAGVSLWDMVEGNYKPASNRAVALPAMKAIYREAGIDFPEIEDDTNGAAQADDKALQRAKVIETSKKILKNAKRQRRI